MVSSDFVYGNNPIIPNLEVKPTVEQATVKPYPWIISPAIDFIFIYGGSFWVLFLAHVLLFGWNAANFDNLMWKPTYGIGQGIAYLFFVLGVTTPVIISNVHTAFTYMRIYANSESREQFKLYGRYLIVMPPLLLAAALIWPSLQGWIIYLHMMWVYQHYTSQTYGIALIYCYKRQYIMSVKEKKTFKRLQDSLALYLITMLLCMKEDAATEMWGVPLPFADLPRPIHYVAIGILVYTTLAFAAMIIMKYRRDKQWIPMPCLVMVLGVAAVGMATGYANLIVWLWGTPFLHGAQYCLVSLSYALKEKGLPEGQNSSNMAKLLLTKPALKLLALAFLGGCFIYIVIPQILSDMGWGFMAMVSVITGCVNFHHFLTDAAIWRLRDPKTRKLLID